MALLLLSARQELSFWEYRYYPCYITQILHIVCRSFNLGDIYNAMVADIVTRHNRIPGASVYDLSRKAAESLGVENRISIEQCVKRYYKEADKRAVTRTTIG